MVWRRRRLAARPAQVRQALGVYAGIPRSVRLIAGAAPGRVAALVLLSLVFSLVSPASVWFSKLLVDALTTQQRESALVLAGLFVGLRIVGGASTWLFEPVYAGFRDRFTFHLHTRLMAKAAAMPDLTLFETPAFYDRLQNARQAVAWAQRLINPAITGVSNVLVFVTLAGTLARLHPLAAAVVVLSGVPRYLAQLRFGHASWRVHQEQTPQGRRLDYLFQLLTTEGAAKEIRLFGLGAWFVDRYRRTYEAVLGQIEGFRRHQAPPMIGYPALGDAAAGAVLLYVVWQAVQGRLGLGDVVLYLGAIALAQDAIRGVLQNVGNLYEAQLHVSHITEFLALEPVLPVSRRGHPRHPVPATWRQGLELRGVTFCYPGTDRPVLRDVSFTLRPGETLALVGHNGAGKTSLVKLLCRLYDPTAGQLRLDGVDLRDYDLEDWRRHITAIFQDYARFQLTAGENVGLADLARAHDRAALAAAIAKAGADDVLAGLPQGLDTPLGRQFEQGVELSLGQWQKLALARAFFRDAPLQILDEPTAALDAEAEYEVYRHFQALAQHPSGAGKRTTILISHRFSTVRMADRILVLASGRLVEEGSHDELVAAAGLYANLYEKQASHYR